MAAVYGFGSWMRGLLPESFPGFTQVVCVMIGGLGLLGLTIFLVGHISLNRWTIGLVLAAGLFQAILSRLRPLPLRVPVATLPAAIVMTVLMLTAVGGLAEPVGDWGIDGVAYHLLGKVWLRNGIIRRRQHEHFLPEHSRDGFHEFVGVRRRTRSGVLIRLDLGVAAVDSGRAGR
jgi:hypothetical protein